MDRFTQYAIVAAREAVKDAQLDINENTADRIGVWIGSGIGGMETFEIAHKQLMDKGPRRVSPFFVPMLIPDMATGQVSIDLGAKGPNVQQLQHVQQVQIQSEKHQLLIWQLLVSVQVERFLQMMTLKQHVVHSKKVEMVLLWVKVLVF